MRTLAFLDEIGVRDAARFGEEAAAAGDLAKAGVPVASAFALPIAAYSEFLSTKRVKESLSACDLRHPEELRRLLLAISFPPRLGEEVREFYRKLSGPRDIVVVVRAGDKEEKASGEDELISTIKKFWVDHLVGVCERGGNFSSESLPLLVQEETASQFSGNLFTTARELENPDFCLVEINHPQGKERFVFEKGSTDPVKRTTTGQVDNPTSKEELSDFSSWASKVERVLGSAYFLTWRKMQEDFVFVRLKKIFLPRVRKTAIALWLDLDEARGESFEGVGGFVARSALRAIEVAERFPKQEVLFFLENPDFEQLARFREGRYKVGLKNLHLVLPPVRTVDGLSEMKRLISGEGIRRGPNLKFFLHLAYPSNVILLEQLLDSGVDGVVFEEEGMTKGLLGTKETVEPDESLVWAIAETAKKCRGKYELFYLGGRARSWVLFEIVRLGVNGIIIPQRYQTEYTQALLETERGNLA